MEDDQRRRQIEEEMARFEQEIFQVQQTLPPPPPPPLAPPAIAASVASSLFVPPQLQRSLTTSPGLKPPPMPPMMMPPKPPALLSAKPANLLGTDASSLHMLSMPPAPPEQLSMMAMPPMAMATISKPPSMVGMPYKESPPMLPSRLRQPPPPGASSTNRSHSDSAVISGKPAVISAPPKKAADLEADEVLAALKKAEAELKEAKTANVPSNDKSSFSAQPSPTMQSGPKGALGIGLSSSSVGAVGSGATARSTGAQAMTANGSEEAPKKKPKKVIRMAGQQVWEDSSLVEWDPDDFRIFCGDLGNDVTDEMLTRVFSKYPTFVKAKVIRDKRTNKSKGYGFVSFREPQGFIKAMRELNGKYVGSRPIKLRKSTWNERNIDVVKKKIKDKQKLGLL